MFNFCNQCVNRPQNIKNKDEIRLDCQYQGKSIALLNIVNSQSTTVKVKAVKSILYF